MSVVNGTGKDTDSLQKTWSDYYSKVEREMVQLASDVGMSYQQLYIRFFEQQSEALNSHGQWWQTAVETTRKQPGDTERSHRAGTAPHPWFRISERQQSSQRLGNFGMPPVSQTSL